MNIFVDTSAFYALMDADDQNHAKARERLETIRRDDHRPITHNYITVETVAILQNRLGLRAVEDFERNLLKPVTVEWIDEPLHQNALNTCITTQKRSVSFVDHVSFMFLREHSIGTVFGFDSDFEDQGFELFGRTDNR